MKKKQEKLLNFIIPIISILTLLLLWIIVALAIDNQYLLPSFSLTISTFFNLFTYSEFYIALLGTLSRSIIAFLISFILALILALISEKYKGAERFFAPIISIIRVLPTIAVVLLLLVWTNSFIAPIIVTFLVVFPTLYLNVKNALASIDHDQIEMCKVYSVDKKKILFKVELPQIMPPLIWAIGAGLSLNLKLMVAAEVLSFTANSIGNYLSLAKVYEQMPTMMALVLVTVMFGLMIEWLFSYLSKKAGRWQ